MRKILEEKSWLKKLKNRKFISLQNASENKLLKKPEDEKTEFSRLVINSFKKIDKKWENEIVEEILESGFIFAFAEESANIGKLIERYIYLMELKKETGQNIYEAVKTKTGNIFELMKGYFYEAAFLFFKENFIDTESDMTVKELGKQIYASLKEYSRDDANVQDMLEEEEFKETMEKLKQYN